MIGRKVEVATGAAESARARLGSRAAGLERAADSLAERRAAALRGHAAALRAADPDRALERGYAVALDASGEPLASAAATRAAGAFELRMADGSVPAQVRPHGDDPRAREGTDR